MDRRVHRLGGILLLLAGVAGVVGGVLDPGQPGPLAEFAELVAQWRVSSIAIGIAGILFLVSTLFLARHFAGTQGEGWTLLGTSTLFLGAIALLGIAAGETEALSGLLAMEQLDSGESALEAFLRAPSVGESLATAAGVLLSVSIAAYSLAMMRNLDWPTWMGWIGVLIGLGALVTTLVELPLGAAAPLPFVLGQEWFAVVGFLFMRRTLPAADVRAPVPERSIESRVSEAELEESLDLEQAADMIRRIAPALAYAEAHGFVLEDLEGGADLPTTDPAHHDAQPELVAASTEADSYEFVVESDPYDLLMDRPSHADPIGSPTTTPAPSSPVWFEFAEEDETPGGSAEFERMTLRRLPQPVEARSEAFREWLSGPH